MEHSFGLPLILTLALATTALTGCGSADTEETAAPKATTAAPTSAARPTTAPQSPSASAAPAAAAETDLTEALRAANSTAPWVGRLVTATQTEPGRLVVKTSIVDPRGANGSPAAQDAIAVCKAAVLLLEKRGIAKPTVSVMEADGTSFVLHNHPAYPEPCTEV